MVFRIIYSVIFIRCYFQDSSSFPFHSCLPAGWTILLFSSVATLVSEKVFLDRDNFWPTFCIHFSIGLTCFSLASFVIYRQERSFINKVVRFRQHSDCNKMIVKEGKEKHEERTVILLGSNLDPELVGWLSSMHATFHFRYQEESNILSSKLLQDTLE